MSAFIDMQFEKKTKQKNRKQNKKRKRQKIEENKPHMY